MVMCPCKTILQCDVSYTHAYLSCLYTILNILLYYINNILYHYKRVIAAMHIIRWIR